MLIAIIHKLAKCLTINPTASPNAHASDGESEISMQSPDLGDDTESPTPDNDTRSDGSSNLGDNQDDLAGINSRRLSEGRLDMIDVEYEVEQVIEHKEEVRAVII